MARVGGDDRDTRLLPDRDARSCALTTGRLPITYGGIQEAGLPQGQAFGFFALLRVDVERHLSGWQSYHGARGSAVR
jgi:hypothetical protein